MKISFMILVSATMCFCLEGAMASNSSGSNRKLAQGLNDVKELLVVRGVVGPDNGSFLPFYRIPVNARNLKMAAALPDKGSHSVVFLDIKGQVLLKIAWTPKFLSRQPEQEPNKAPFTWLVIPPQNVAEVHLQVAGRKVSGFQVRMKASALTYLRIEFIRDVSNLQILSARLTWSLSHPSLEKLEKVFKLLYQVYYSNDDRKTWLLVQSGLEKTRTTIDLEKLPGGRECFFRVVVTDGFNSSTKTSQPFSVSDKPPTCVLMAPRGSKTYRSGAGVLLIGRCVDLEDRNLPDENLVWTSDLQGVLGYGQKLVKRDLSIGFHIITLTCRDSASNKCVSQPLELEIIPRLAEPLK